MIHPKLKIVFVFQALLFSVFLNAQVPKNISLISTYNFAGQRLAGCWHYEDSTGHPYALIGAEFGIAIMDLDTPSHPQFLFQLPGVHNLWHEVKVQGQYAYAVSEGTDPNHITEGLQIIDLRYLPDSAPSVFYKGDGVILNQIITGHSVTTAGHYVYINGHNISNLGRGVLICDISNPMNPVYVGSTTVSYCHDSYVRGDTLWTSELSAGFSVYNISNHASPVLLANQPTPANFNHNGWLSDNGHYFYTTDETGGAALAAFDVSDLSNITLVYTYFTINMPSREVHNVRVLNDYLINPSYGSQMTIVDAAHPDNLVEIGNYPTGNSLCWDADPYLSSGLIIATDMNSGDFFVFQPLYIRACYLEGNVRDSLTGLALNGVTVQILTTTEQKNTDPLGNYKMGIVDSGTYSINFTKTGYFDKIIPGVVLTNGVLTTLNTVMVPTNSGIAEPESANDIVISPNPFEKFISIRSTVNEIRQIRIFDKTGKSVQCPLLNRDNSGIKLLFPGTFASGIYFLELITDKGTFIRKIIRN